MRTDILTRISIRNFLERAPDATVRRVVQGTGYHESTVRRHLNKMLKRGQVRRQHMGDGRYGYRLVGE